MEAEEEDVDWEEPEDAKEKDLGEPVDPKDEEAVERQEQERDPDKEQQEDADKERKQEQEQAQAQEQEDEEEEEEFSEQTAKSGGQSKSGGGQYAFGEEEG